jgi:hypothetical protein
MRWPMGILIAIVGGIVGYCAGHPAGDQFMDGYIAGAEDTTHYVLHGDCRSRIPALCDEVRREQERRREQPQGSF